MTQSDNPYQPGMLVRSRAGRDKGSLAIIVARVNSEFVLIADGKYRKQANPKLKRTKHLQVIRPLPTLVAKIQQGTKVWDSEIFAATQEDYED